MHYRITKVYHEAGKREALAELLNEKKEWKKYYVVLYIFHLARKVQSAKKSKLPNNSNL